MSKRVNQTERKIIQVDSSMVYRLIKDMKTEKTSDPSGITAQMFKMFGGVGPGLVT